MTPARPILFALPYPGHLRYFDSVIRELAERGHDVQLWFHQMEKQREGLQAVEGVDRVTVAGLLPKRADGLRRAVRTSRVVFDFARYLDPRFADAEYLRDRVGRDLPGRWQLLRRLPSLPEAVVRRIVKAGLAVERSVPTADSYDEVIRRVRPGLVVVAPAVMPPSSADLLKSAQRAGIATVGAVSSWDNLTTKGLFRVVPDRVLVWNEEMAAEAADLHLLPKERIHVTGAQPFDRWFDRHPLRDLARFTRRVGLPEGRPYLLFVGSTESISDPDGEIRFVLGWLQALRASAGLLRDLPVMVRPHPYNHAHWPEVDLSQFGSTVLWPRSPVNPVDEDDRADYFDSIQHAVGVVGINTSAMIEAAIQRKPVFTITLPDFRATQSGTVHFRYLLPENGGFVRVAGSVEEHLRQLEATLDEPAAVRGEIDAFISRFVRPRGLERSCTPIVVDALEEAIANGPTPPLRNGPVAGLLSQLVVRVVFARLGRRRMLLRRLGGTLRRRVGRLGRPGSLSGT